MACKKNNNNQNNEKSKFKKEYINNSKKYVANTYARFDLVLESAKDTKLKDIEGKEYIDLELIALVMEIKIGLML